MKRREEEKGEEKGEEKEKEEEEKRTKKGKRTHLICVGDTTAKVI